MEFKELVNEEKKDIIKGVSKENEEQAQSLLKGFDRYVAFIDDGDTYRRKQASNKVILDQLKDLGVKEVILQVTNFDGKPGEWKLSL